MGTATGTPPVGDPVSDSDPSHYFGTVAGLDIEKSTNGEDADDPPGSVRPGGRTRNVDLRPRQHGQQSPSPP